MRPASRAAFLIGVVLGSALAPPGPAADPAAVMPAAPTPLLLRVQAATVATDDLAGFASRFKKWLGYRTRPTGVAMASFAVASLDGLALPYIGEKRSRCRWRGVGASRSTL